MCTIWGLCFNMRFSLSGKDTLKPVRLEVQCTVYNCNNGRYTFSTWELSHYIFHVHLWSVCDINVVMGYKFLLIFHQNVFKICAGLTQLKYDRSPTNNIVLMWISSYSVNTKKKKTCTYHHLCLYIDKKKK